MESLEFTIDSSDLLCSVSILTAADCCAPYSGNICCAVGNSSFKSRDFEKNHGVLFRVTEDGLKKFPRIKKRCPIKVSIRSPFYPSGLEVAPFDLNVLKAQ